MHVCIALTDRDLTTSTSKAPTDAILGEIDFLGMMTAILEAFAHFLRKLTLMFVLCKTHRYLSNEEANSGKVRWWELWMQQCSVRKRSPATQRGRRLPIGRLDCGWSEQRSDWSVGGNKGAATAYNNASGQQGVGLPKLALGTQSIIIIIIYSHHQHYPGYHKSFHHYHRQHHATNLTLLCFICS